MGRKCRISRKRGKGVKNFRLDDEGGNQEAIFQWCQYHENRYPELRLLFHVPNGGKRDRATAMVLKRQGVKAGVPDLVLPVARGGFHGAYIELKAGKNTTTQLQKQWLKDLRQQGYFTTVCYGWEEAVSTLTTYLDLGNGLKPADAPGAKEAAQQALQSAT